VLEVRNLSVTYAGSSSPVRAVSSVSLTLHRGELAGLAGESGCGKSTLALALSRLLPRSAEVTAGNVTFYPKGKDEHGSIDPIDVLGLSGEALRQFRWARLSMVFQGAMNSLNPVLDIGCQLGDAIKAHERRTSRKDRRDRAGALLDMVGVGGDHLSSYPHQLSGGMRQRVMLAMALTLDPDVVIMDEPTTALDVVVQREILDQVRTLQARLGFAVLFITHDLSLLLDLADRSSIMYGGRVVEEASSSALVGGPAHPYTIGLLNSFPSLEGDGEELVGIPGSPPDLAALPQGCAFAPRCSLVTERCRQVQPGLDAVLDPNDAARTAACWNSPSPFRVTRSFSEEPAARTRR